MLTIACHLSVRCLWQGFAGSVKFHFVIIPLFSHSSVSKYCFSKSSLLPSCKDLLLPCSCKPPAVPQNKQFHPFGESSKGSTLSQKCTWTDSLQPHQRQRHLGLVWAASQRWHVLTLHHCFHFFNQRGLLCYSFLSLTVLNLKIG